MSTKSKVIKYLELNKGDYISGAALAEKCGVSRNAIWKAINELRKQGYNIESVNNRGYLLDISSDVISAEGIELFLKSRLNRKILVYDEVDSTNTEAKRLLIKKDGSFSHGSVIVAGSQTAGRGHDGTRYESPEGGIYITIFLQPTFVTSSIPELGASVTKNVIEKIIGTEVTIKDKNRLYIGRKKICGILSEGVSDLETGVFTNFVIGIGIDFRQLETPVDYTRNQMIAELIDGICG